MSQDDSETNSGPVGVMVDTNNFHQVLEHFHSCGELTSPDTTRIEIECQICLAKNLALVNPHFDKLTRATHERYAVLPRCGHAFGSYCLVEWLLNKHSGVPACPSCRTPVYCAQGHAVPFEIYGATGEAIEEMEEIKEIRAALAEPPCKTCLSTHPAKELPLSLIESLTRTATRSVSPGQRNSTPQAPQVTPTRAQNSVSPSQNRTRTRSETRNQSQNRNRNQNQSQSRNQNQLTPARPTSLAAPLPRRNVSRERGVPPPFLHSEAVHNWNMFAEAHGLASSRHAPRSQQPRAHTHMHTHTHPRLAHSSARLPAHPMPNMPGRAPRNEGFFWMHMTRPTLPYHQDRDSPVGRWQRVCHHSPLEKQQRQQLHHCPLPHPCLLCNPCSHG